MRFLRNFGFFLLPLAAATALACQPENRLFGPVGEGGATSASSSASSGGGGGASSSSSSSSSVGSSSSTGASSSSSSVASSSSSSAASSSSSTAASSSSSTGASSSSSGGGCASPNTTCPSGACVNLSSDPANCGSCGHSCLGGMCSARACQPVAIASGQANPLGLAQDATSLYWANEQGGSVAKVAKSGGAVVVLATGQAAPWEVATDGMTVFWVTINGGTLMSIPVGGGTPKVLASGLNSPGAIAVGPANVFWSDGAGIAFMPKAGAAVTRFSPHATAYLGLDTTAGVAYWTYLPTNSVESGNPATGVVSTLATNLSGLSALSVAGGKVYFATGAKVMSLPLAGGTPSPVATDPSGSVTGTFADATAVYWTNNTGTVRSIPLTGGTVSLLASNENDPAYVLTDTTAIYWIDIAAGTIMKLAK